jgi:uncharacterized protein (TIGR03086 family)
MTTCTKTAVLPVSVDEAFALITQPERLRRWQTVTARIDLRVGGDFRWTVTPGHIAAGTVREIEPGKRIVLGWGWEGGMGGLEPDASTITITLTPVGEGTEISLVHEGLTEEQAVGHAEGWDHFLERLVKLATTGDAGQDEWAAAPENLDHFSAAEATLAVMQPILRGLTTEDRERQTPCQEFTGHELAEHLFGSLIGVGGMAGANVVNPEEGSLENRVSTMAGTAIEAWRARGVEGMVSGPGGHELPATVAATILSIEFLIHAWDFAQTSGQQVVVSDEVVAWVRDNGSDIIAGGRERGDFTDAVEVAADASPLDKLAAFAGRRALVNA